MDDNRLDEFVSNLRDPGYRILLGSVFKPIQNLLLRVNGIRRRVGFRSDAEARGKALLWLNKCLSNPWTWRKLQLDYALKYARCGATYDTLKDYFDSQLEASEDIEQEEEDKDDKSGTD